MCIGSFSQGVPIGNCIFQLFKGNRIESIWQQGVLIQDNITFKFLNGSCIMKDYSEFCKAKFFFSDRCTYEGTIKYGLFHGTGCLKYNNNDVYTGHFSEGEKNGQGIMSFADGAKYVGEFLNGEMHGKGTFTYCNGDIFIGSFKNGFKFGLGEYHFPSGDSSFGFFEDDERSATVDTIVSKGQIQVGPVSSQQTYLLKVIYKSIL